MSSLRGFTLIEVAATLVIVGTSLVSILSMFYVGGKRSTLNQQKVVAYNLLQRYIEEEVFSKSFTHNAALSPSTPFPGYSDFELFASDGLIPGNPFLKQVDVSVRWDTPYGSQRTEKLTVLKADY